MWSHGALHLFCLHLFLIHWCERLVCLFKGRHGFDLEGWGLAWCLRRLLHRALRLHLDFDVAVIISRRRHLRDHHGLFSLFFFFFLYQYRLLFNLYGAVFLRGPSTEGVVLRVLAGTSLLDGIKRLSRARTPCDHL